MFLKSRTTKKRTEKNSGLNKMRHNFLVISLKQEDHRAELFLSISSIFSKATVLKHIFEKDRKVWKPLFAFFKTFEWFNLKNFTILHNKVF